MKTIKDLTDKNINDIYSIIVGKEETAIKIEWGGDEHDFVVATFKTEESYVEKDYDTVSYGIQITEDLEVHFIWMWNNEKGMAIEHQPLHNQHYVTKYLLEEGFKLY